MSDQLNLIQFGCGLSCPNGWSNYDASPRLKVEKLPILGWLLRQSNKSLFPIDVKFGNIVKGLPHPELSVDAVYCSHVLEHLDRESAQTALSNTFKLLKHGGTFRLVVPDLTWRITEYISMRENDPSNAADIFLNKCHLGRRNQVRGVVGRIKATLGNSAHLWMYDGELMSHLLHEAGFINVKRCDFGDAKQLYWGQVEERSRFEDGGNRELAFQAMKP